ncbi:pyridoxamine 5'-phosphate oxidase family protein [uncultured Winogradskyella sp.]|uniref:pyridoxamine 5'-phosphate oxidase family protein n=1 Tax=uncultured Winogradskyella sp. TaxID=395353 RepID=UPI002639B843|nr:pyridoxamine 5'-phosphate oxidase family protein [uncultured Winogradskyella sp.]
MIQKLDKTKCRLLLSQNYIGHLSYIFSNKPYVVPITYYYDDITNSIIGYSGKGHKIRALRINRDVSMEVSDVASVNNWKSVLVQGIYREFEGSAAMMNLYKFAEGVKEIIRNVEGKDLKYISEFSNKIYKEGQPIVFKIHIEELTGRERKY